jgi:LPS sulfotransferase NodH
MRKSRETFFEQNKPSMLRIAYETLRTSPEQVVMDICEFLEHEPDDEQLKNAVHFIQNVRNDLCY